MLGGAAQCLAALHNAWQCCALLNWAVQCFSLMYSAKHYSAVLCGVAVMYSAVQNQT